MRTQVGLGVVGYAGSSGIDVAATSAAIVAAVERSNAAKAAAILRKVDAEETKTATAKETTTGGATAGTEEEVHDIEGGVKDFASALRMQHQNLSRANRRRFQDVNQQNKTATGSKTVAIAKYMKTRGEIIVDVDDGAAMSEERGGEDEDENGENECTNRNVAGYDRRGTAKVATVAYVSKPSPKRAMQTSSPLGSLGTKARQASSSPSARRKKSAMAADAASTPSRSPSRRAELSPHAAGVKSRSPSSALAHRRALQQRSAIFKTGDVPKPSVVRSVLANSRVRAEFGIADCDDVPSGTMKIGRDGDGSGRNSSVLRLSGSHRLGPDGVIEVEKGKPTWETRRNDVASTSGGGIGAESPSSKIGGDEGTIAVAGTPTTSDGFHGRDPDNDRRGGGGGISARSGENYLAAIARAKKLDGRRSVVASAERASPTGRTTAHGNVDDVPPTVEDGTVVGTSRGICDAMYDEGAIECGATRTADEAVTRSDFAATRMAWATKLERQKRKVSSVRKATMSRSSADDNRPNVTRGAGTGDDVVPSSRGGGDAVATAICVSTDPGGDTRDELPSVSPLHERYERNKHFKGSTKKPNTPKVHEDDVKLDIATTEDAKPLTSTCVIKDDAYVNSNIEDNHSKVNENEPTPHESIVPIIDMDRPDLDPSDGYFANSKEAFAPFEPQGESMNDVELISDFDEEAIAFASSSFNPDLILDTDETVFDNKMPASECCDDRELTLQELGNGSSREDGLIKMNQGIDDEDDKASKLTSEWGVECSGFASDIKFNDWCCETDDDLNGADPSENIMGVSDDGAATKLKSFRIGLSDEQQLLLDDIVAEYEATINSRTQEIESMKGEMTDEHMQIESLLSKHRTKENDSEKIIVCLNKEISDLRLLLAGSEAGRVGKSKKRNIVSFFRIGTKSIKTRK